MKKMNLSKFISYGPDGFKVPTYDFGGDRCAWFWGSKVSQFTD